VAFAGGLGVLVLAAGAGIQHYGGFAPTSGVLVLDVAVGPPITATDVGEDAAASTTSSLVTGATAPAVVPPSTTTTAPPPPARAPYVVVVGDSTAAGLATGLQQWGADTGRLRVASVTSPGCATYSGTEFRVRDGYIFTPVGCDALFRGAADLARTEAADALVVFIGSSQLADWRYPDRSGWHHIEEPAIGAEYRTAMAEALGQLESAGIPILWADVPTPDWDLDAFSDLLGSGGVPGSGTVTMNDPERAAALNALATAVITSHPAATIFPWTSHLAGPDGTIGEDLRADGLHVSAERIPELAETWLMDLLDRTYDEVVARAPDRLTEPADHAWSR
jgi:hypothetical protein